MTAEPIPGHAPVPDWVFPPPEGFTVDDLDRLPGLPPHTELLYGSLIFVSPQSAFRSLTMDLLVPALRAQVPADFRVRREMTVRLAAPHGPEPDIMVVRADSVTGVKQTAFAPEDVELVVEVVSRESVTRDRDLKPGLYARAGIPHFWRIENVREVPTIYVFELDPATKAYAPAGIFHGALKLAVPFDLEIDLTEISRL